MSTLKIEGGRVIDPANGIDDEVRDLWIADGTIVAPPDSPDVRPDRTIDARGCIVMPGGVDVHCHIAGPKVNTARLLRPEEKRDRQAQLPRVRGMRSGTLGSVPSTFTTGYKYAGLGYTTAVDAAVPPLGARHAHFEFNDTPILDKGLLVLLGNNHYVMDQVREGEPGRLRAFVAWILGAAKGLGVKVVNPGGVEGWKQGRRDPAGLDDVVDHFGVTPRQILGGLASAIDELGLPHPIHVHCNRLGVPGNWETTLATMRALDGHRAHFTHVQFHSYGGDPDRAGSIVSKAAELAEFVNRHPTLTVDVGQVLFGDTTSMTADGPVGHYLHAVTGRKWVNNDVELETGCGIVPIQYDEKNVIHALQWAIGLEWFLRVEDPWRIAMSTDHPNGGSFLAYPHVLSLLMEANRRDEVLGRLPARVAERSPLRELRREYTLAEVAILTRAAPARILGLAHKGHLGTGADGDVTIYANDSDLERMFAFPRFVIKAGETIVDDGKLRACPEGRTLHVTPEADPEALPDIESWFSRSMSLQFANYPVRPEDVPNPHPVACGRGAGEAGS